MKRKSKGRKSPSGKGHTIRASIHQSKGKLIEKRNAAQGQAFLSLLRQRELPQPVAEFRFHPERRWRIDFCWPELKVALEVEGGALSGGRHTSGMGFVKDMEKYNELSLHGYTLIRCIPSTTNIDSILMRGEIKSDLRLLSEPFMDNLEALLRSRMQ